MSESTELTVPSDAPVDPIVWKRMAYDLACAEAEERDPDEEPTPTLVWLSDTYDISKAEALAVISNPVFAEFIHNMTMAIARTEFDLRAIPRLREIIRNGSNKESLAAIRQMSDMLGHTKPKGEVQINISIEDMVRARGTKHVVDGEVIEIEGL